MTFALSREVLQNMQNGISFQRFADQISRFCEQDNSSEENHCADSFGVDITLARKKAYESLFKQAKKMKFNTYATHAQTELECGVIIQIPDIEKGKADF